MPLRWPSGCFQGKKRNSKMAKAYWIAHVTVTNPEAYAGYQAARPRLWKVKAGSATW